jgi:putative phosphoesterase
VDQFVQLGGQRMRIAIFSDIHANLPALEAALERAAAMRVDEIYCLGDIVGYGGNPNECVDLVRDNSSWCVAGNHDRAAVEPRKASTFSESAREVAEWTNETLTPANRKFLQSLPLSVEIGPCTLVHASPVKPSRWHYVKTLEDAENQFKAFDTVLCFIGHTHVPVAVAEDFETTVFRKDMRYLINVGSVGQSRDGNPDLSFGFLDTDAWYYETVRVPYNIEVAADAIKFHGLPSIFAERLYVGI